MSEHSATQPVHEISAWTGEPQDESPICGADKWDPSVWSHRTVYTSHVTCPNCIRIREEWSESHD